MNKFFVYRDCIKELKQQLSLVKVSGLLPSREEAKKEGLIRFKGRNNVLWKAGIFVAGAMWAKMKITGISDVVGNDH
jgi:hypothetical protein